MAKLAFNTPRNKRIIGAAAVASVALIISLGIALKQDERTRVSGTLDMPAVIQREKSIKQEPFRRAKSPPEPIERPGENLVDEIREAFTKESIRCENGPLQSKGKNLAVRFDHGSYSINNPVEAGIDSSTIALRDRVESEGNPQVLFEILEYLDSIGVIIEDGNRLVPRVQRYQQEGWADSEDGMGCIEKAGKAYRIATIAQIALIERALDSGELDIQEVIDRSPAGFEDVLYDRMSISLFENDDSFSAEETDRILIRLSEDQKLNLFNHLLPFVYINDSYRETAGQVLGISSDRGVKSGLRQILHRCREMDSEL